jgi:uncharacterized membrane protein HdeD (DUF308 family)
MATARSEGSISDVRYGALTWQVGLFVGLVTLALGIVVTLHPSTSINVIAVLLGVLLIVAGVFHLVRSLDRDSSHRAWAAVVGLAFIVLGVVLIRHLHLTRALIALLIGLIWIVQGVAELFSASDPDRPGRGWSIAFGLISLAAGIVVIAVPTGSLNALAILLGIWFIVMGVLEVIGAFYMRRLLAKG